MYCSKNKHCCATSPLIAENLACIRYFKMAGQLCFRRFRSTLLKLHVDKVYLHSKAFSLENKGSALVRKPLSLCSGCMARTFCSERGRDSPDDDEEYRKMSPVVSITQGPFGWIAKNANLWIFKTFYDREFEEKEFLRGAKQALCVVSDLLNKGSFDELEGVLSDELTSSIRNRTDAENLGPVVTMKQIISANIQKVRLGFVDNEISPAKAVVDIKVAYMFASNKDNGDDVVIRQFGNIKIISAPIPRMVYYTFRRLVLPDSANNWQVTYISYVKPMKFNDL